MALQQIGTADYINVVRGNVPGASNTRRTGFNPGVGTSETTVWNETTTFVAYPATAAVVTVSSSSANDTSAGTGARTVTLSGLDANYNVISEVITMNGQTAVTSVNLYLRLSPLTTLTAGSGGKNAGVIYAGTGSVSVGVPATIYSSMGVGYNESHQAFYTVPAGMTGYITDVSATTDTAGTRVLLYTRVQGGVFLARRVNQVGVGGFARVNQLPLSIPAKTDIEYRALVGTGTANVSAQFELLLMTPS